MKIKILAQEIKVENTKAGFVEGLFVKIESILNEANMYFSHLEIDGIEINDNFKEYIYNNQENIKTIVVKAVALDELISSSFLSARDYLKGALPEVKALVDKFYQGPGAGTWEKLELLLEGMQWLLQMTGSIVTSKPKIKNAARLQEFFGKTTDNLAELKEAIAQKDNILIGDIINYEILPLLELLYTAIDNSDFAKGSKENIN